MTTGTDPFVPDRQVTVRFAKLQLKSGDTSHLLLNWQFRVQRREDGTPDLLVHSTADHSETILPYVIATAPLPHVENYCTYLVIGNASALAFDNEAKASFAMVEGESVTLRAEIINYKNDPQLTGCIVSPTVLVCKTTFTKTISYKDIADGTAPRSSTGSTANVFDAPNVCEQDITYEVFVE